MALLSGVLSDNSNRVSDIFGTKSGPGISDTMPAAPVEGGGLVGSVMTPDVLQKLHQILSGPTTAPTAPTIPGQVGAPEQTIPGQAGVPIPTNPPTVPGQDHGLMSGLAADPRILALIRHLVSTGQIPGAGV